MTLITEAYSMQLARWPRTGQHILAQYDDSSVVVYQAYRPSIGRFAAREWIIEIENITDFVHEQYEHVRTGDYGELLTPRETVYPGMTRGG